MSPSQASETCASASSATSPGQWNIRTGSRGVKAVVKDGHGDTEKGRHGENGRGETEKERHGENGRGDGETRKKRNRRGDTEKGRHGDF